MKIKNKKTIHPSGKNQLVVVKGGIVGRTVEPTQPHPASTAEHLGAHP